MIKAIIVDDEPGCISNLQYYLTKYCPQISIVATGGSIEEAKIICNEADFDIAFLDVEMGNDNTFSLLKNMTSHKFEIVFVTAFESYALKAFKVQALDYILKPLMKSDILDCYQKIIRRYAETHLQNSNQQGNEPGKLLIKQGDKVYVVKQTDVHYLKAHGVYTQVVFDYNGKHMSLTICKPIGDLEKDYDPTLFFRVHKSFLINQKKITGIVKGNYIQMGKELLIPIAKRRAQDFLSFMEQNK